MDIRKHLSKSGEAVAQLPREVVQSLSLDVFQNRVDVALRDVVSGHGGGGLAVGSKRSFPALMLLFYDSNYVHFKKKPECPSFGMCSNH